MAFVLFPWILAHKALLALSVLVIIAIVLMAVLIPRASSTSNPTPTPTITPPPSDAVSMLTWNILNANVCNFTPYSWNDRKAHVAANIQNALPDFFFLQEATKNIIPGETQSSIDYIQDYLGDTYSHIDGASRSPLQPESVPLFYRSERLTLLSSTEGIYSQFGCSGEPDEDNPRTYTAAHFTTLTNQEFWAYGSHFPKKQCSALQQADADELIAFIESTRASLPYFVMSDFNNGNDAFRANIFIQEQLSLNSPANGPTHWDLNKSSCSFNSLQPGGTLDRILNSPSATLIGEALVLPGSIGNLPASDHSAVYAAFDI